MKMILKLVKKWVVVLPVAGLVISIITSGAILQHIKDSNPPTV
jgi:hypothetical protein